MGKKIDIIPEPDFNRIKKTLLLEEQPERLPLCDFGISKELKEWVLDGNCKNVTYFSNGKDYHALAPKDEVSFWVQAGYDFVCTWPYYNFALSDVKEKEGSVSAEGIGIIKSLDDLNSQKWPWQDLDTVSYENVINISKEMPADMKIIILAHDIFTYAWENMGFTHYCLSLYEDPELVEKLMHQLGYAIYTITERTVNEIGDSIGGIWYADDLAFNTGPLIEPENYRKYLFPWVKKMGDLAASLSVPFIYHTDGNLWELFNDLYALGVNAIHPLEPKSMVAEEVKEKEGKRFCLIGNIDVDLLSRGDKEEIVTLVKDRIKNLGKNGGYCVGSSNTLPPYINPLNFKAMVETTFTYSTD
jgi:uroporphyrinogen decarboxylase